MKIAFQNILNKIFLEIRSHLIKQYGANISFPNLNRLVINITTRCNFNCPHCLREPLDADKTIKMDMPIELFEKILKGAKKLNYKMINFTGGEPILHPQFKKLVELTCRYGYYYTIVSNGWFYQEYWPIISENKHHLLFLTFSIDGATANIHDQIRNQPGSFKRVIEAIKFYKEKKIRRIMMFTCLTQKNRHQIQEIISLAKDLGVDIVKFLTPITPSNFPGKKDYSLSRRDRKEILGKIKERASMLRGQKIECQIDATIQVGEPHGINFCYNVMRPNFYIDPAGSMHFCCNIHKVPSDRPDILKDGLEKSFLLTLDIVNEIKKRRLKDLYCNKNHPDDFYTCEYCNQNIESVIKKVRAEDKIL